MSLPAVPAQVLSAQLLLAVTIFLLWICPVAHPDGLLPSLICAGSFTPLTTNASLPYPEPTAVTFTLCAALDKSMGLLDGTSRSDALLC